MRNLVDLCFYTLIFVSSFLLAVPVSGQSDCLTEAEAARLVSQINSDRKVSENKALRRELLKMQETRQAFDRKIINNWAENQKLIPAAYEMGEKHLLRLCEIIKQYGWVEKSLVGEEGANAALYLIKNNKSNRLQRQIFPVVAAAAKKGDVPNGELASLIDIIRVASGLPQIFGTQAVMKDELFYLNPLQNEARVDEWRKLYDLPPLSAFIRSLQAQYQMPVLKSPLPAGAAAANVITPQQNKKQQMPVASGETANSLLDLNEEEVLKVESNLVNLNVSVHSEKAPNQDLNLQKSDFAVFENGSQQEITFFSAAEAPFDLVLLLDLSGSTQGKKDLIRKSTRRFIEAARPSDRIAIVTFTDRNTIVSGLTRDREKLLASIKNIDDLGGSGVWGGLKFVYEKIIKPESGGRRSAIVIMTDGVDSSLLRTSMLPADYPTFTDLLETVRSYDTAVIPIYLDTETGAGDSEKRAYRSGRRTLSILAEETGNQMYTAKKLDDLDGIYQRVINDLGKVYSLGYQPDNETRDGGWRSLSVRIPNRPDLIVRTKKGYYAK